MPDKLEIMISLSDVIEAGGVDDAIKNEIDRNLDKFNISYIKGPYNDVNECALQSLTEDTIEQKQLILNIDASEFPENA